MFPEMQYIFSLGHGGGLPLSPFPLYQPLMSVCLCVCRRSRTVQHHHHQHRTLCWVLRLRTMLFNSSVGVLVVWWRDCSLSDAVLTKRQQVLPAHTVPQRRPIRPPAMTTAAVMSPWRHRRRPQLCRHRHVMQIRRRLCPPRLPYSRSRRRFKYSLPGVLCVTSLFFSQHSWRPYVVMQQPVQFQRNSVSSSCA